MILPQTAEYALRALAQMSVLPLDAPVRAIDLAKLTSIPEPYLSKILRKLVAEGLLASKKGHGGGFRLARPPAEIRFIDALRALEIDLETKHCAFGWGECSAKDPCLLHPAFTQLNEATLTWATKTTLADLTVPAADGARKARRRA